MKKITLALILVFMLTAPALAVFSSKGQIPNGEPLEYRGLKVTSDGVNIIIVNRGDKTVTFSAALAFVDKNRKEVGDVFIEETVLEPQEHKQFTKLYLKGDEKLARKAESLRWTIYTLEEK
ncbi:MAG: hypothetical protein LLF78_07665 [Synergistaceae bacterium]|nr:hypothetical protein [Synergistaceae bacterium]